MPRCQAGAPLPELASTRGCIQQWAKRAPRARTHPPVLFPCLPARPQVIQFEGEDGTVATVTSGPYRTCAGGAVYVVDAPLT